MAGDVVVLKSVVHSLRVQAERDLGGRDGREVLGFLKPAEILFGVSPDRSVALPKQSHIMRTTFLLVSANMALSGFAEWANFYKACVCMFVFYFGQLWANRIEDALQSESTQPVSQEAPASLSGRGPDSQQVPMFRGKGRR
ncbi:hypothetical protein QBC37DRAFT_434924 [Rhypophila decipiens]|uniref:Uncharacterized protein n=1 Tax=Rhypophila decipiens TaxID=261697 RepID=A0AAN7B0J8_9PEZI|nr:hypothetical protein QBC37DRAFT_434924 [Rhypophila decipiens]